MILRTLAVALVIAVFAACALALLVLAVPWLHRAIVWIASDERTAWGCVAAAVIVGLVFVMGGKNRR